MRRKDAPAMWFWTGINGIGATLEVLAFLRGAPLAAAIGFTLGQIAFYEMYPWTNPGRGHALWGQNAFAFVFERPTPPFPPFSRLKLVVVCTLAASLLGNMICVLLLWGGPLGSFRWIGAVTCIVWFLFNLEIARELQTSSQDHEAVAGSQNG